MLGLLALQLWTGRLLSYCEVALLGFRCLGWRWGTPVLVTCVPILLCVPSVSTGNLATHPVPGTISLRCWANAGTSHHKNKHWLSQPHTATATYAVIVSAESSAARKKPRRSWGSGRKQAHPKQRTSASTVLMASLQPVDRKPQGPTHANHSRGQ